MATHAKYVSTLIAPRDSEKLGQDVIDHASEALGASGHTWLGQNEACDLFHDNEEADAALAQLLALETIDHVTQKVDGRQKRLLLCDMDSTMIEQECIDELAAQMDIKDQVAEITEKAMRGEIAFDGALRERVGLLKGLSQHALQDVYDRRITYTTGGRELVQTLRQDGVQCVLVSGGFTFFTSHVAQTLGFHANFANTLEIVDEALTGKVHEPILGADAKLQTLHAECRALGCSAEAVVAVGDGANDLPMLQAAGLGVAFRAKPKVQEAAGARLNHSDLGGVLYALGYKRDDWKS